MPRRFLPLVVLPALAASVLAVPPTDPKAAYRHLRNATITGAMEIPNIDLQTEIGGYDKVKKRHHAGVSGKTDECPEDD